MIIYAPGDIASHSDGSNSNTKHRQHLALQTSATLDFICRVIDGYRCEGQGMSESDSTERRSRNLLRIMHCQYHSRRLCYEQRQPSEEHATTYTARPFTSNGTAHDAIETRYWHISLRLYTYYTPTGMPIDYLHTCEYLIHSDGIIQ